VRVLAVARWLALLLALGALAASAAEEAKPPPKGGPAPQAGPQGQGGGAEGKGQAGGEAKGGRPSFDEMNRSFPDWWKDYVEKSNDWFNRALEAKRACRFEEYEAELERLENLLEEFEQGLRAMDVQINEDWQPIVEDELPEGEKLRKDLEAAEAEREAAETELGEAKNAEERDKAQKKADGAGQKRADALRGAKEGRYGGPSERAKRLLDKISEAEDARRKSKDAIRQLRSGVDVLRKTFSVCPGFGFVPPPRTAPAVVFVATDTQEWCAYGDGEPRTGFLTPISDTPPPGGPPPGVPAMPGGRGGGGGAAGEGGGTAAGGSGGSTATVTSGTQTPTASGPTTTLPSGAKPVKGPNYCGPDVTRAYMAALQRVSKRMQGVPDSEKGPLEGARFLERNGWNIDQWPSPETKILNVAGECPSGWCSQSGNEKGQLCYTLFGFCVPRHVLNDIMLGFTADQLGVPFQVQKIAGHFAEARFNIPGEAHRGHDWKSKLRAVAMFADPAISQRSYELGDELSEEWGPEFEDWFTDAPDPKKMQEWIAGDWAGFLTELKNAYPWLAQCVPCPDPTPLSEWSRDWSRHPWRLADGTTLPWQNP